MADLDSFLIAEPSRRTNSAVAVLGRVLEFMSSTNRRVLDMRIALLSSLLDSGLRNSWNVLFNCLYATNLQCTQDPSAILTWPFAFSTYAQCGLPGNASGSGFFRPHKPQRSCASWSFDGIADSRDAHNGRLERMYAIEKSGKLTLNRHHVVDKYKFCLRWSCANYSINYSQ